MLFKWVNLCRCSTGQFLASLAYDDGRTDVHLLAEEFVECSAEEMEKVRALLDPAQVVDGLATQLSAM